MRYVRFGVALAAFSALGSVMPGVAMPALAMEFATVPIGATCIQQACPRAVIAEGEITAESPAKFSRFLQSQLQYPGLHALMFINSPGGNVESALQLGALLHRSGVSAVVGRPIIGDSDRPKRKRTQAGGKIQAGGMNIVPGQCASACVYVLMGAKKRVVPDGARLGVHRMSARIWGKDPTGGTGETGRIYAGEAEIRALRQYAASVGGSQDLISLAESVPHDRIRLLSAQEIRRYRLGEHGL